MLGFRLLVAIKANCLRCKVDNILIAIANMGCCENANNRKICRYGAEARPSS